MTGLEALDKLDEVLCDIEIKHKENLGYTKPLTKSIEKSLKALEIIKPLCEVVETPVKKFRYLKVNGVVVYTFKTQEEFDLLKEVLE